MAEYQPLGIQNFTGQVGVSPDILQFLQGVSGQAFGMGNRVLGQREKEYATQLALQQAREQQALRMQREQQALQNYYAQFQQPKLSPVAQKSQMMLMEKIGSKRPRYFYPSSPADAFISV